MINKSLYYIIGRTTGLAFFLFINGYAAYDAFLKIRAGESFVSSLALIFAFAAWRKTLLINAYVTELYIAKESENDLYRSSFQSDK